VGLQLGLEFVFRVNLVFDLCLLLRRLRNGACRQSQLDLLATLVICDVGCGYADHAKNLDFVAIATRQGILNAWKVFRF
jgi:hypothetical protein